MEYTKKYEFFKKNIFNLTQGLMLCHYLKIDR